MAKRCPPGVICVENITILFVLSIVACVYLYMNSMKIKHTSPNIIIKEREQANGIFPRASYSFSNVENDVLMNPYKAPLKDDRINNLDPRGVPINVPTQSVNASYRQVGILTRLNGNGENILPLMGKPLFTNRDK